MKLKQDAALRMLSLRSVLVLSGMQTRTREKERERVKLSASEENTVHYLLTFVEASSKKTAKSTAHDSTESDELQLPVRILGTVWENGMQQQQLCCSWEKKTATAQHSMLAQRSVA